jgi:hypothetical protein
VRRNIKRELPCKLTEEEFTRISRSASRRRPSSRSSQDDLAKETRKRKDQIEELEDEVAKMGRELHLEQQDRTVPCNEVFRRALDGTGWIHTIRLDTYQEVERRPATAHETQRYLPNVETPVGGGLLGEAARAQRSAQDEPSDVPESSDGVEAKDDDASDDQGDSDKGDSSKSRKGRKGK